MYFVSCVSNIEEARRSLPYSVDFCTSIILSGTDGQSMGYAIRGERLYRANIPKRNDNHSAHMILVTIFFPIWLQGSLCHCSLKPLSLKQCVPCPSTTVFYWPELSPIRNSKPNYAPGFRFRVCGLNSDPNLDLFIFSRFQIRYGLQ